MALEIRSSATNSASGGKASSSSKSSSTDIFSLQATSTKSNAAAAAAPAAAAKPAKSQAPKSTSATPAKTSGSSSSSNKAATANAAATKPKTTSKTPSSDDHSTTDSTPDASANAANGTGKGRTVAKGGPVKAGGSQTTGTQATNEADSIADPSKDVSNASGLSLLQLLAQSLEGDSTSPASSDTTAATATDTPGDKTTDATHDDANAQALAMFTQALAAALGASNTVASQQAGPTKASPTGSDTATSGITDTTRSTGGADTSMQDLVSLLAKDVAAGTPGKGDAAQPEAGAKPAPNDPGTANTATLAPNSAQLGVASHFSLQHARQDTNSGELKSPLGTSAWNDELGGQLTWMTQHGLESGSLRVSPDHLGPVEVKISVQNGDASVWFGANHPDTRAALEQALPRLREMFAGQGLTLTDSGVSRESPRNQTRSPAPQSVSSASAIGGSEGSAAVSVRMSLGLVDTYA